MVTLRMNSLGVIGLCAVCGSIAHADPIYETPGPFGGPFGLIGFDVSSQQSVAIRFTADFYYVFDSASVWIMSNDFNGPSGALVRVTLRTDENNGSTSTPSEVVLDEMFFNVSATGWNPVLETVQASSTVRLERDTNYWLVLECDAPSENPVWNWATGATGFTATTTGGQTNWQPGGGGAVPAVSIEAHMTCYGDCDANSTLNIFDYICFGGAYSTQHPYGDCDGNQQFNVFDYICFGNAFAGGCP